MADVEADHLYRKYEDITIAETFYCMVCLRTEKERTLVVPKSLKSLRAIIKMLPQDSERVCLFCEQQASNALKLIRTMQCACILTRMMKQFKEQRLDRSEFGLQLDNFKSINKKGEKTKLDYKNLVNIVIEQSNYIQTPTSIITTKPALSQTASDTYFNLQSLPETIANDDKDTTPIVTNNTPIVPNNTPKLISIDSVLSRLPTLYILPDSTSNTILLPTTMPPDPPIHLNTPVVLNDKTMDKKRKNCDVPTKVISKSKKTEDNECTVCRDNNNSERQETSTSRVDWEDKIPKDVICVVQELNVKEPKVSKSRSTRKHMRPGIITEVRSLSDREYENAMPNLQENNNGIIDLC